jgi:putative hydrolase of the HAD superfamily
MVHRPRLRRSRASLRAVLFDSVGTLVRPASLPGHPSRALKRILLRHWPAAPIDDLPRAFRSGAAMLARAPTPGSWEGYCRTVLAELGMGRPPRALLDEMIGANPHRMRLYPDVPATLGQLRERGLPMVVVTDSLGTAESLRYRYEQIGLGGYFEYFAVAGELGCTKPDPAIYRAASDALGVPPEQTCYVDDQAEMIAAATRLGYHGLVLSRDGAPSRPDLPYISALHAILELVSST